MKCSYVLAVTRGVIVVAGKVRVVTRDIVVVTKYAIVFIEMK